MNTIEMTMSSSKTVGVEKQGNKWRARISVDGKTISLGMYDTKEEAIQARKLADEVYGFSKNHGR